MGKIDKAKIKSIYDVIVCVYLKLVEAGEELYLQQYLEIISGNSTIILEEQKEIIKYLKGTVINDLFSPQNLYEYLELIMKGNPKKAPLYCVCVMMEFDSLAIREVEEHGLDNIISYDELSTINSKWHYIPLIKDNYIMDGKVMQAARIKKDKGIWEYIDNYKIIADSNEHGYEVSIKRYNVEWIKNEIASKKALKIAVVPFSRRKMFDENSDGIKMYRVYEDEDYVFKRCISLLQQLEESGVDIIAFPELAMTVSLKKRIQTWLGDTASVNKNIKLIFLGSYYEKGVNRCVLLTRNGRQLLTNDKRNAFSYNDSNGNRQREKLGNFSKKITLLDVPGLGRIYYSICKDAITIEDTIEMTGKYRNNFNAISSASPGLQNFMQHSNTLAANYSVFSVMANSCSERDLNSGAISGIGFVGYPVRGKNNFLEGYSQEYSCNTICADNEFCACSYIFEVYADELQEYEPNKKGVKILQFCH